MKVADRSKSSENILSNKQMLFKKMSLFIAIPWDFIARGYLVLLFLRK
jgi:hypothetical protein